MALVNQKTRLVVEATITLNEMEIRALDALFCYGVKSMLESFYKHCGTVYMRPYESGLVSLAESVRNDLMPIIKQAEASRAVLKKAQT